MGENQKTSNRQSNLKLSSKKNIVVQMRNSSLETNSEVNHSTPGLRPFSNKSQRLKSTDGI